MPHRIRVVGILRQHDQILLVEQQNPVTGERRWSPPGGGLEIDDSDAFAGVEREVLEETGLRVRAGRIRFVSEYANHPEQMLMLTLWIECQPLDPAAGFGAPSLANARHDDYLVDVRWWDIGDLHGRADVAASLQKADFWAAPDAPEQQAYHLGRREH
jgi:ADP-ribose pyrophosphatase YjhB (NUDIX family)